MKYRLGLIYLTLAVFLVLIPGAAVSAESRPIQPKGLFITPPRQYIDVAAGSTTTGTFTVGNLNDSPMKVTFSVDQFSLANYTYDYKFSAPKEDWVKISQTQLDLPPKTSKKVTYSILTPANASPGGHYFSIFASTTPIEGKQVRTGLVLYATVKGKLEKTSQIISDKLPSIIFGQSIPLQMDIKNTGNSHFFIYASGTLSGWFSDRKGSEVANLLLPQTIRSVNTTLPAPVIPGIYKATYGYRDEDGHYTTKQKYIAYAPIWSFAVFAAILWLIIILLRRKRRLKKSTDS